MTSFGDTGIGGSARLPLPDKFISLFKAEALRVLENAEVATAPITDDALNV